VLDEGIKSLLAREPELAVSTVTYVDPNELLKEPLANHDIIVLCEVSPLDWIRTCELLRGHSHQKNSRVIIIRLEDNVLEIYDKQYLKVARKNDLINIIRHP